MKNYTSCFIGIPIPEKYQKSFEKLLKEIPQINPLFKAPYMKTPHITVCYLDKQSQEDLFRIAEKVRKHLAILENIELKIGGFDYFKGDEPRVVFLDVEYPKALKEFNEVIARSLAVYAPAEKLPFHPHVTVSWVGDPEAQRVFKAHQSELEDLLDKIDWTFKLTEIVLYGADSAKQPEYQEKLISLKVK